MAEFYINVTIALKMLGLNQHLKRGFIMIRNFEQLIKKVQTDESRKRVVVIAAHDKHTLEAVLYARSKNIADPILIGDAEKIRALLAELGETVPGEALIEEKDDCKAAFKGVQMIREGQADFIMKGKLQSADFLSPIVDKKHGLRTDKVMSHFVMNELPNYHKLLVTTDGGMFMYPNLNEKRAILENAVDVLHVFGYRCPKVAALAAVETVNSKMPETVDAAALQKMNQDGVITGCIVEGPISYDLAMSSESAEAKGYASRISGDCDILLSPNITAGNILGKALLISAEAKMAGFVVGASVPVVMTSRGATAEEKYLSLALSAAYA